MPCYKTTNLQGYHTLVESVAESSLKLLDNVLTCELSSNLLLWFTYQPNLNATKNILCIERSVKHSDCYSEFRAFYLQTLSVMCAVS